jgi:hypothetical protein
MNLEIAFNNFFVLARTGYHFKRWSGPWETKTSAEQAMRAAQTARPELSFAIVRGQESQWLKTDYDADGKEITVPVFLANGKPLMTGAGPFYGDLPAEDRAA